MSAPRDTPRPAGNVIEATAPRARAKEAIG